MSEEENEIPKREFLGIMFNCCGVYGRIYKNKDKTAYVGRCPRCMRNIRVPVGEGGTNQRFFDAY
jgi:hypothetical protein